MSKRTYTLELTAEELDAYDRFDKGRLGSADKKLNALIAQAAADRKADELRLPWRAAPASVVGDYNAPTHSHYIVIDNADRGGGQLVYRTEHAAKLMSAAPELLEAVQAVKGWADNMGFGMSFEPEFARRCVGPIMRALRKVETGLPE